jgi:hypothetical protein
MAARDDKGQIRFQWGKYSEDTSLSAIQAAYNLNETISLIKSGIESGHLDAAREAWQELTDQEKELLWVAPTKGGVWTVAERKTIKDGFKDVN